MTRIFVLLLFLALPGEGLAQSDALRELHVQVQDLFVAGHYAEALPHAEEAAQLAAAEFGAEHPTTAILLFNLAEVRRFSGHLDEALTGYSKALAIQQTAFGLDHLKTAGTLSAMAATYDLQGELDAARPIHDQAVRIISDMLESLESEASMARRLARPAAIYRARQLNNRAMSHHRNGRLEDAELAFRTAANTIERNDGKDSRELPPVLANLAAFLRDSGREDEAAEVEARLSPPSR